MTATNMSSNFGGFRWRPPLTEAERSNSTLFFGGVDVFVSHPIKWKVWHVEAMLIVIDEVHVKG